MASSVFIPSSPDFEVLHFKQGQGENLKDAWFIRMLESYRSCVVEGDFKILMRNFYVGLTPSVGVKTGGSQVGGPDLCVLG